MAQRGRVSPVFAALFDANDHLHRRHLANKASTSAREDGVEFKIRLSSAGGVHPQTHCMASRQNNIGHSTRRGNHLKALVLCMCSCLLVVYRQDNGSFSHLGMACTVRLVRAHLRSLSAWRWGRARDHSNLQGSNLEANARTVALKSVAPKGAIVLLRSLV